MSHKTASRMGFIMIGLAMLILFALVLLQAAGAVK